MYQLSDFQRQILLELWGRLDLTWWGPQVDDFFADHMERVADIEDLLPKSLIKQEMDPKQVFRFKFTLDGFLYLPDEVQTKAMEGANEVIAALKALYRRKKSSRTTIAELSGESGLAAVVAFRALVLLRECGLPLSANLEGGPDSEATYFLPGVQVAKVADVKALLALRKGQHDRQSANMIRMMRGDYRPPIVSTPIGAAAVTKAGDPVSVYDVLIVHPAIRRASRALFADKHYSQAILEAFKMVNILVKEKSKSSKDGQALMSEVFSPKQPLLRLNRLATQSDADEQQGLMLVFMGVMTGIRNPKAHEIVEQSDPCHTLQYLALADLLARRVDEASKQV